MKAGKLSEAALKRSVLKQLHTRRPEVLVRAGVGNDAAALRLEAGEVLVMSTDPITLSSDEIGGLGIIAAMNDVACLGAEPVAVLVNILLPTSSSENELRDIMKSMEAVCGPYNIEIMGGHTEVTRLVNAPIITVTGVGKAIESALVQDTKLGSGLDIVATKWIGLEGTSILAREKRAELETRFAAPFIDGAEAFSCYLPIWSEAAVAAKSGACAMHDVSEGGIYGALWELAERAGVGLEVNLATIPIRQETVEICEFFDLNPYKLLGGGCLLVVTADGEGMVAKMEEAGFAATVIGRTTDSNDRILFRGEEKRFLETAQTDELVAMRKDIK